jgi:photosystem II stability/assembly factor-like uncharacterized protein
LAVKSPLRKGGQSGVRVSISLAEIKDISSPKTSLFSSDAQILIYVHEIFHAFQARVWKGLREGGGGKYYPVNAEAAALSKIEGEALLKAYGEKDHAKARDGLRDYPLARQMKKRHMDPAAVKFKTIQFLDANNGWVCGDYGYVYKTTDGGKTWVDVSPDISGRITDHYRSDPVKSESPPDGWFVVYDPLYFFNVEEGFVCGFRFNPTGRQPRTREGLVFETKAGGQTWARRAVDPQDYLARLEFSERLNCDHRKIGYLFYLDRMTAWKFGGENTILRTTNGGRDWRSFQIAPDKVWFWRGLAFTDEKNGFVIGELSRESARGVLYGTADGGESWVKVAIDCPALHAIALSPSKIYIVGKEGTILLREKSHEKALFCMSGTQEVVELGGKVITPKKGR